MQIVSASPAVPGDTRQRQEMRILVICAGMAISKNSVVLRLAKHVRGASTVRIWGHHGADCAHQVARNGLMVRKVAKLVKAAAFSRLLVRKGVTNVACRALQARILPVVGLCGKDAV